MLKYLHLQNVGPAPEMKMELASRVNLITGDNGLGKSFLLDVAWWSLTRRWPQEVNSKLTSGYPARPSDVKKAATIEFGVTSKTKSVYYTSKYEPREESWLGKSGRPWNPGLVIYAQAEGGFSVWDPARNYWKKQGNVDIQERLPAYVFSPKEVWDGLKVEIKGRETPVCNGLLIDWASWIREHGTIAKLMAGVLSYLSEATDPQDRLRPGPLTRISIEDGRDIPSLNTGYSSAVPILHASAGVRRIVALAYMLIWSWKEHSLAAKQLGEKVTAQVVFLIDELESHLHPRWQRSILAALLEVVTSILHQKAKTQIIAATHSPLVLASAEPIFNPDHDAWFDLDWNRNGHRHVELTKRKFVRRGNVSNWLTSDAFGLKQATSIEAEQGITKALALLESPSPSQEDIDEVDRMLKASLSEVDRFWVRWSEFRNNREKAK
jgi:AAA domain, putative AbiEii toxin, Type IV TA system